MQIDQNKCRHTWKFAGFVTVDNVLYAGFACDKCQLVKITGITQDTQEPEKEEPSELQSLDPTRKPIQQQQAYTPEELKKIQEVKDLLSKK